MSAHVTDEEILAIAEKFFPIGLHPQSRLRDMGDGTMRFVRPEGLTPHGEKVLLFARALLERAGT